MKQSVWSLFVIIALLLAVNVWAASVRPVPEQGKGEYDATHVVELTYEDWSETSTNTEETITDLFVLEAKQGVECVAMYLVEAFSTGNTNYTGSSALMVGDSGTNNAFLTSTELNSDGTEVWLKYGTSAQQLYTSADYVSFTLTPNEEESLSELTAGKVRVYFRLRDADREFE